MLNKDQRTKIVAALAEGYQLSIACGAAGISYVRLAMYIKKATKKVLQGIEDEDTKFLDAIAAGRYLAARQLFTVKDGTRINTANASILRMVYGDTFSFAKDVDIQVYLHMRDNPDGEDDGNTELDFPTIGNED